MAGTGGDDQIALRLAPGNPGIVQVVFDGTLDDGFDRTTFSKIVVVLGNGDDRFDIDQTNGTFSVEQVTVIGGNGGDDVFTGGDGAEVFIDGNGEVGVHQGVSDLIGVQVDRGAGQS